jgi:hypothetical protein
LNAFASLCSSGEYGTSINSANVVSVIDGKSLIAVNVTLTSTLPPVP